MVGMGTAERERERERAEERKIERWKDNSHLFLPHLPWVIVVMKTFWRIKDQKIFAIKKKRLKKEYI